MTTKISNSIMKKVTVNNSPYFCPFSVKKIVSYRNQLNYGDSKFPWCKKLSWLNYGYWYFWEFNVCLLGPLLLYFSSIYNNLIICVSMDIHAISELYDLINISSEFQLTHKLAPPVAVETKTFHTEHTSNEDSKRDDASKEVMNYHRQCHH